MKKLLLFSLGLVALNLGCEESSMSPGNENEAVGNISFSITDAPIDDSSVSAAFVTITEIKVDGKIYEGFQGPKTINLLELQNGNSLSLGNSQIAAKSYSTIDLVINAEQDATNSGPGCYILKSDGSKDKLELSGSNDLAISLQPSDFEVAENGTTEIIMDFDLRKSIRNDGGNYSFVSNSQLTSAVRAENKNNTGNIKGKVDNYAEAKSNVVVYVYKKGSFSESSEVNGNGGIKYSNSISSAKVDASGNFTLAFLPEGNYEIICDKPESGSIGGLGINTLLNISSSTDLSNVGVNALAETSLSLKLEIGGLLNL
ncbi:MAG: hypothetical protein ACI9QN_001768 [Arcticibacterium sp.]|jgi:hypothetical protein